jgi:hypothetical protein
MKYLALLALLITAAATSQTVPPQSHFEIWVKEDGQQGFLLRVVFAGNETSPETAARASLPSRLAEKHWCLRGWSIETQEVTPVDRPKSTVVALSGTCRQ